MLILNIYFNTLYLIVLLQADTAEYVPVKDFTTGSKIISGLLTLIGTLIWYIWNTTRTETKERHQEQKDLADKRHQEQKEMAETRHRDTLRLFKELSDRQKVLEDEHRDHKWELHGFRGFINKIQGKEFEYDNPRPDRIIKP